MIPTLALIGGFLGAGKTTLILSAARVLRKRGMRVAAIMNDQDQALVDTRFAEAQQMITREVAGGCFCCRFSDLMDAADQLAAYDLDVIFAEPVGSCIDLSATILQPLKAYYRGHYRVTPLTVLIDPGLAAQVYTGECNADVDYLFRKQIAEADIVCTTKRDLHGMPADLPVPVDFSLSAKTGEGMEQWLDEVLQGGRVAGSRLLEVDYSRYGEAEAALGWLNLHADVKLKAPASAALLIGPLLEELDAALTAAGVEIAHLKIFDQTNSGSLKAGICANGGDAIADGDLLSDPERDHSLAINLRAIGDPEQLRRIVSIALDGIPGIVRVRHSSAFRPAQPRPEHRFTSTAWDNGPIDDAGSPSARS